MSEPAPASPYPAPGFSRKTLAALLFMAWLKIWLISGQALTVIWNSDERTFLLQVQGLLAGTWLGDYTIVTLVKNPFYALFIAGSFLLGIPALLAQQLMYVGACGVFLVAARPAIAAWGPYRLILLYALLVFNPMSFLGSPRLLRNHLYASLTLLLLACSIAIITRVTWGLTTIVRWSVACGVVLSALWLTREESVWLVPYLAVFTALEGWRLWQAEPGRWLRHLLVLALPYGLLALSILTVAILNQRHYGVFTTNEIQSRAFLDAHGAIYRVIPRASRRPYDVAPKETRERIYAVSPAFAALKDGLEGAMSQPWAASSCREYQICTDNDVAWGWFMWELREAAWRIGHHRSAVDADRFYARIAAEINAACASGTLDCLGKRSSVLPPWESAFARALPGAFVRAFVPLITFRDFRPDRSPSVGTPAQLAEFHDISRDDVAPPRSERFSMTGWVLSTKGDVELSVRSEAGHLIESNRRAFPRPDVHDYVKKLGLDIPRAADSGFELSASCGSGCYVHARTGHADWIRVLPIDGSVKRFQSTPASELARATGKNPDLLAMERGDVLVYIDAVKRALDEDVRFQAKLSSWKMPIMAKIALAYRIVVPVLCVVALLVFLAHLALSWRYRVFPMPDLIVVLVLTMLCSRTAALAFIDVVAIRISSDPDYAMSGYPLVLLFGGMLFLDRIFRMPSEDPTAAPVGATVPGGK